MKSIRIGIVALLAAIASVVTTVAPTSASTFFAWSVTDVPAGDTLNVRAWPSSQSLILVAYPNGAVLSMTGKCTGGVDLNAVAGWPAWKQRQAVRYQWCETWVDPYGNGQFRTAWVYGKYIRPA